MIIVSGPSTIGKNPFIYRACEQYGLEYVVPYTTRKIRTEETNGKDYYFLSKQEFQLLIRDGRMTEWDYSLENYYGYDFQFPGNSKEITHGLSRMALRIKKKHPNDITTVFLMPRNIERVVNNVNNMYTGDALFYRQALIKEEVTHSVLFDKIFTVENSTFELFCNEEMLNLLQHKDFT